MVDKHPMAGPICQGLLVINISKNSDEINYLD